MIKVFSLDMVFKRTFLDASDFPTLYVQKGLNLVFAELKLVIDENFLIILYVFLKIVIMF